MTASSSDAMRTSELFQLRCDQGPRLEAYRAGRRDGTPQEDGKGPGDNYLRVVRCRSLARLGVTM